MRVGLVSDTHGLFEPRLRQLFAGCDLILHAGDTVTPGTLEELARVAPVRAVRGNNDLDPAFASLPELAAIPLGSLTAVLVHRIGSRARLDPAVRRAVVRHGASILVHGHSHRPAAVVADELLLVNPGSAGPRRFSLPRTAGLLEVADDHAIVRLFDLGRAALPEIAPAVRLDPRASARPP